MIDDAKAQALATTELQGSAELPRIGYEVELLAPKGSTRLDLATLLADRLRGTVRRGFHVDSETSTTPGVQAFWNLTPAFEVRDASGEVLCTLVDDTTIVDDLDASSSPRAGWFRILSDDARLLRVVQRYADPTEGIGSVLNAAADVFGAPPRRVGEVYRLDDPAGATIAMAVPLPGERERPCEVITPPYAEDHLSKLRNLLKPARDAGFTVPAEAAVHMHLDAKPFRDINRFRHLVRLFGRQRHEVQRLFSTNPRCRRLDPLPEALLELVEQRWDGWEDLRTAAAATGPTKYCDVKITRVLGLRPGPDTLEVRIFGGSIDADSIVENSRRLVQLLDPA